MKHEKRNERWTRLLRPFYRAGKPLGALGVIMALGVLFSCGDRGALISEPQFDIIGEMFATLALSPGSSAIGNNAQSVPLLEARGINPLENCSPQKLIPPSNCGESGNIYTTINLTCSGPSGCCGADPPCEKDTMSIEGTGSTVFNTCTTSTAEGDRVVIDGTIYTTLTVDTAFTCSGIVSAQSKVTLTGRPSFRVNGREVCNGDIFITVTAFVGSSVYVIVSGNICDQYFYRKYDYGCSVDCGSYCCPSGAVCATCTSGEACFAAIYPVDCCNGYACPAGTTCTSDGKCQY